MNARLLIYFAWVCIAGGIVLVAVLLAVRP